MLVRNLSKYLSPVYGKTLTVFLGKKRCHLGFTHTFLYKYFLPTFQVPQ